MNETMFARTNMTGRIFICLVTDTEMVEEFEHHFITGDTYYEARLDGDGGNDLKENDDYLLLLDMSSNPMYVKEEDFMLTNKKVQPLAMMPICIN